MEGSSGNASASSIFPLITSLPLTSPSLLALLSRHRPFSRPSLLPSSATRFLARITSSILARDTLAEEKHAALHIAKELVLQDTEGWVLAGWGKEWVGSTLGALSSASMTLSSVSAYLSLLQTLVLASPQSPSFERESIHPIMGKLSTTLLKLLDRAASQAEGNQDVLHDLLQTTRLILVHAPAAFRPAVNTLRALLLPLIVYQSSSVHSDIRDSAISLLTILYHTQGKAQVAQGWRAEMGDGLLGVGACLDAIVADGWQGDARAAQTALPPGLAPFPADTPSRLPVALIKPPSQTTSRPVPVPIAHIVRLAIRCLDLTLDTPTVPYISPQHHANLVACLPRIWTSGMMLLGNVATACGDHLLPHLTDILDTTLHLAEITPDTSTQSHTQLLRLHNIFLDIFPSATWYPEHPARLLKLCISKLSPLLDSTAPVNTSLATANGAGGKKGKKRARGEEDGLLASLEGREGRRIGVEGAVALEALQLISKVHPTPLLPPSLLMLSIRLHLALYLSLPTFGARRFADPAIQVRLIRSVRMVLQEACLMVEESGHSQGWKSVVLSVLEPNQGRLAPLLHPQLPAISRPAPPLSSLHFFTVESEEEAIIREELGLGTAASICEAADEDEGMEAEGAVDTVVVPVAPNDVRAGKKDVADVNLPSLNPGHTVLQTPSAPQPGHYPPAPAPAPTSAPAPVLTPQAVPAAQVQEAIPAKVEETGMGSEEFISFDTIPVEAGPSRVIKIDNKMDVDDDGSDHEIPDLDSELSGFEDDDDDDEEEE
ncbi:uncharacterized protein MKK02DRAFT_44049 [Dioszegia hungarica]|uniref:Pre-rRNA-processing protein RIX1 n=1 Tax=Dioszegia hungarica TaxID=4972 RepID=A0AA38H7H0_9TREE|nr:uncharacterized protein MKK02DRAFT_44049 [Dioszegia hungarica]KAI9635362.1 hypothetical protein MKK02DRAFT_44049 [Dioszegia hungarica]